MSDFKIKVMIVDDIPETRQLLAKLLAFDDDIEIVGKASDGLEAIRLARKTVPDVVLMDIGMPHMDGIRATRVLVESVPTAAVVIVSVVRDSEYLRRAIAAGARDYLTKPLSYENLVETIRRVYNETRQ
mgnify:CR=1 FL=1